MSDAASTSARSSIARKLFGDVSTLPGWQKAALAVALATGGAGGVGMLTAKPAPTQPAVTTTAPAIAPGTGETRGFVGSGQTPAPGAPATAAEPAPEAQQSWFHSNAGALTGSGIGFIGAFLIGWAFRVFVKTMVTVALLGVALLVGLSYFNVINIDFSAAKETYATHSAWLWDQATRLKDLAMAHLPASGAGAAGLFVGLRKK